MSNILKLYEWYLKCKRDLPWRKNLDPYRVMVSEIMLQQTRVEAVIPKYNAFMEKFSTLEQLATASEEDVLIAWEGLGYYSRAKNLQKACKYIYFELENEFPKYYVNLIELPGIGDYTASAISSICFNENRPVLDGNVIRIVSRIFLLDGDAKKSSVKRLFMDCIHKSFFYKDDASNYNQAMMELGALICTPKSPKCDICPVADGCRAFELSLVHKYPYKAKKTQKEEVYLYFYLNAKDGEIRLSDTSWKNYQSSYISPPYYESSSPLSDLEAVAMLKEDITSYKAVFTHSITKYKISCTVFAKSVEVIDLYRKTNKPKSGFLVKALKKL